MTIITGTQSNPAQIAEIVFKVVNDIKKEASTFNEANLKRVDALLHGIQAGKYLSKLKAIFLNAPNKNEVVSDLGTFKGWSDFLLKNNFSYKTVESYIFMYQHRQEFAEMKLTSKDPEDLKSGAAGHRKIASIKAVKWYLEKIANEGEHIRGTLTACDYQKEVQGDHKKVKESKYVLRSDYDKLKLECQFLREELAELKKRLSLI